MLVKSKPDAKPNAEYATCYEHAKPNAESDANLLVNANMPHAMNMQNQMLNQTQTCQLNQM